MTCNPRLRFPRRHNFFPSFPTSISTFPPERDKPPTELSIMSGVAPLGGMGLVADPREGRQSVSEATGGYSNRVLHSLHDKQVTFEEYLHYAKISRDEENRLYGPGSDFQAGPGPTKSFIMRHVARKQSVSREDPAKRFS